MSVSEISEPVTVVIPTLNVAATLPAVLEALRPGLESNLVGQVIVADGGSEDATWKIATEWGAETIQTEAGRGVQMAAGADAARCPWLLFLHADTVLEPGWQQEAGRFLGDPRNRVRAGAFRFALDDPSPQAHRLERMVRWRNRVFGLAYGDQGLFISHEYYNHVGGIRALPLMEDVDLVRRIGRRRMTFFQARAITSAARFRANGYLLRSARNLLCLMLFYLRVPPWLIARIYSR